MQSNTYPFTAEPLIWVILGNTGTVKRIQQSLTIIKCKFDTLRVWGFEQGMIILPVSHARSNFNHKTANNIIRHKCIKDNNNIFNSVFSPILKLQENITHKRYWNQQHIFV